MTNLFKADDVLVPEQFERCVKRRLDLIPRQSVLAVDHCEVNDGIFCPDFAPTPSGAKEATILSKACFELIS